MGEKTTSEEKGRAVNFFHTRILFIVIVLLFSE